jgi:hypothetical protein
MKAPIVEQGAAAMFEHNLRLRNALFALRAGMIPAGEACATLAAYGVVPKEITSIPLPKH